MLMLKSLNGCAFATIAILCDGETVATAFTMLDAQKIATLLRPSEKCTYVPVFSDTWHYDMEHAVSDKFW